MTRASAYDQMSSTPTARTFLLGKWSVYAIPLVTNQRVFASCSRSAPSLQQMEVTLTTGVLWRVMGGFHHSTCIQRKGCYYNKYYYVYSALAYFM